MQKRSILANVMNVDDRQGRRKIRYFVSLQETTFRFIATNQDGFKYRSASRIRTPFMSPKSVIEAKRKYKEQGFFRNFFRSNVAMFNDEPMMPKT